jgi:transcriptional regulator with XRE-family HTH domain
MNHEYALDLRVARRKSGLTQVDCGHLLGVDPTRITKFETGRRRPSLAELSILCLVLNAPIGQFSEKAVKAQTASLRERLALMPDCPVNWRDRYNRLNTLNRLGQQLEAVSDDGL